MSVLVPTTETPPEHGARGDPDLIRVIRPQCRVDESGQWALRNSHSGPHVPVGGTYCREYQQTVTIDGKQERSYGTACRQPDGTWKIVG